MVTRAALPYMRKQNCGRYSDRSLNMYYTDSLCGDVEHVLCRVVVTSSTSGLYGSFSQMNYSAG